VARIGKFIVRDSDISRVKLELITFFKDNPGTVDSAENISIRLGRSKDEVAEALEQLAEHGILYRTPSRPVPIYMYYPAAQILQRIAELAPDMDYSAQLQLVNELLVRRKAP
jgi:predicted transcriptional regulator